MSNRYFNKPSLSLVVTPKHPQVNDVELAHGLMDGNAWAIAETWHRFAPMVLTTAARALGSESEAEDVAQEVFHRLYRKAKTLRDPSCLRSFIFSFLVRVLKSELRGRASRSWLSFHQPETIVDLGGDSVDMEARDLLRRFYALLDRLSPKARLIFAFRHLESMTVEEVAKRMDISESTVKRSLLQATFKLSRWIETDLGMVGFLEKKGWKT